MNQHWFWVSCSLALGIASPCGCDSSPGTPVVATGGHGNGASGGSSPGGATSATGGNASADIDAGPPIAVALTISGKSPKTTSSLLQGVNYWSWVVSYGNQVAGTEPTIAALKPGLMRLGGTNADNSTPQAYSNAVIETAVAYARAIGAEPLIQVPVLEGADGNVPTAQTAADIVSYLNVTKSLGVKYFSIGNEPDIYVDGGHLASYSVDQYCQTFSAFADAMKQVDPTIRIVGPDFSWKYQLGTANDWMTAFLTNCKTQVDVVVVHRYPLDPAATTQANAQADAAAFRTTLTSLRSALDAQGMTATPLGITEANITWDGDPAKSTLPASPGTFLAGMWTADVHGVALEQQLWTLAYWSISEGWTLGMLNGTTPRPAYYALKLYADHFGPTVIATSGAPSGVSAYASRNAGNTGTDAVIVNWNASNYDFTVSLRDLTAQVPDVHFAVPALSLSAFEVTDAGQVQGWTYRQSQADSGAPPVALQ
jgi:hypothetical protein